MTTTTDLDRLRSFLDGIITIHGAMRRDVVRLPGAIEPSPTRTPRWALVRWFAKFEREVGAPPPAGGRRRVADAPRADAGLRGVARRARDRPLRARPRDDRHPAALPPWLGATGQPDRRRPSRSAVELRDARSSTTSTVRRRRCSRSWRAVPSPPSFAAIERELLKATPKRVIAFELPFAFDGLDPDEVAAELANLPLPLRTLYRLVWEPAYRRLTAPLAAAPEHAEARSRARPH